MDINRLGVGDRLPSLLQKENKVGYIYSLNYAKALVLANDLWKERARGIPHNSLLLAASFDPEKFAGANDYEKTVILLRVIGASPLPQDADMMKLKVDYFQDLGSPEGGEDFKLDEITQHLVQFNGLECRVIGCFYQDDNGQLHLGSDVETYSGGRRMDVYRPRGDALEAIVNYVDPVRKATASSELARLGIEGEMAPIKIGTVRYTSTTRLHRDKDDLVPVHIQPLDFLGRRTAVLGMTRTGKSNMVKTTVSVVKRISEKCGLKIGQIIYDPNGEYSNANQQDLGAISEVYADTVRYRALPADGFEDIRNDFHTQLQEGYNTICTCLKSEGAAGKDQPDIKNFIDGRFDLTPPQAPPGGTLDFGLVTRHKVMIALYRTLLFKAGFTPPQGQRVVKFGLGQAIYDKVLEKFPKEKRDFVPKPEKKGNIPQLTLSLEQAAEWFKMAYHRHREDNDLLSSSGNDWFDEMCLTLVRLLSQENSKGAFINGHLNLQPAIKYHFPGRTRDVSAEIYQHLVDGKIVIVDLSVGAAEIREYLSKDIAREIFERNMQQFTAGETPPFIVVYIEEAHNLIGKNAELTETWPRIAKEGAKFRLSLVYSTQEPSSVHKSVLSATENWFITHLNNENEVKEISKFYDFGDYAQSIHRAQDVGFARIKTLSSPFVIPTQIDKFDPEEEKKRAANSSRLKP